MKRTTTATPGIAVRRESPPLLRLVVGSTFLVLASAVIALGLGEPRDPAKESRRSSTRVGEQEAPAPNDPTKATDIEGAQRPRGAVSLTTESPFDERARSIVSEFELAPETWDHMRSERPADLAREVASMRAALADLRGESDAIHAGADRAVAEGNPQANAGVAGKLQPILQARRKLAAEMMIASLAKQARATEAP
jgi:hypothetical protein